jgi:hypothetical protein
VPPLSRALRGGNRLHEPYRPARRIARTETAPQRHARQESGGDKPHAVAGILEAFGVRAILVCEAEPRVSGWISTGWLDAGKQYFNGHRRTPSVSKAARTQIGPVRLDIGETDGS